ncbi:MAG: hypothetical protein ACLFUU_05945 [Desulfobacteraceae bacterium]
MEYREIIRDLLETPFYSDMRPAERLALVKRLAALYFGLVNELAVLNINSLDGVIREV